MVSFRDKTEEPGEVIIPSQEAVFVYAGRLEDGTQVVRDSGGLLHALVPVKRHCPDKQ
jgi:hypothetical protein